MITALGPSPAHSIWPLLNASKSDDDAGRAPIAHCVPHLSFNCPKTRHSAIASGTGTLERHTSNSIDLPAGTWPLLPIMWVFGCTHGTTEGVGLSRLYQPLTASLISNSRCLGVFARGSIGSYICAGPVIQRCDTLAHSHAGGGIVKKLYVARLTEKERTELTKLANTSRAAAYRGRHAQVLLEADQGRTRPWTARPADCSEGLACPSRWSRARAWLNMASASSASCHNSAWRIADINTLREQSVGRPNKVIGQASPCSGASLSLMARASDDLHARAAPKKNPSLRIGTLITRSRSNPKKTSQAIVDPIARDRQIKSVYDRVIKNMPISLFQLVLYTKYIAID